MMNNRNGFLKIKYFRILGAEIFVHWSTLIGMVVITIPFAMSVVQAVTCAVLFFVLILLHEVGHAWIAKNLGYQPTAIVLKDVHGVCIIEYFNNSDFSKDEAKIAWGGVLAQLIIAIPLILLTSTTDLLNEKFMAPVVGIFGFYSVLLCVFNLLPLWQLDGTKAWKLFSIWWKENSKRKSKIRRIK